MSAENKTSILLIFFSTLVIFLIGSTLILSSIIFFLGGDIRSSSWIIAFAGALILLIIAWVFRTRYSLSVRGLTYNFVISFAIIAATGIITGKFYDKSWDGLTYHQMAVLKLSEGWNPFYESLPDSTLRSEYTGRAENMYLYVNHYAKGSEVFAAVVTSVTGNIETGKVFNPLFMLAAFAAVLHLLLKLKKTNVFWSVLIAFAAAFNPITVNQLFSYYVDGAVGSLILLLTVYLILMATDDRNYQIHFASIAIISIVLANFKFTGTVYLILFCSAFIAFRLYVRQARSVIRFIGIMSVTGLMAIAVVGFNPYVRNAYYHGHPLYPIAGDKKLDVITGVMPADFENSGPFKKFISSTFARCDNFDRVDVGKKIEYKIPFSVSIAEIRTFQSEATRQCGFGVWWSAIFCLAIVAAAILIVGLKGNQRIYFGMLLLTVFASVFSNPEAWWARFVPQLWLFPLITCFFLIGIANHKALSIVGKVIVIVMIVNSTVIGFSYGYAVYSNTKKANLYFKELKKRTEPALVYFDIFLPNVAKLKSKKIPFLRANSLSELGCTDKVTVLKMRFCEP
jgi:hypothetical protein